MKLDLRSRARKKDGADVSRILSERAIRLRRRAKTRPTQRKNVRRGCGM